MEFGEKIKKLRTQKGDSLRELGEKLNFHYSNLSKVERGERKPTIDLLQDMCNLYKVPMTYFFDTIEAQPIPDILKEEGVEYIAIDKSIKEDLTEEDIKDALELIRDLKKEGIIDFNKLNEIKARE